MATEKPEYRTFTMRIPKDLMLFLKKMSAEKEKSMADILLGNLINLKKRLDAKEQKNT